MSRPDTWSNVDLASDLQDYLALQNTPYGGRDLGIELSEVPRSRAPSWKSQQSLFTAEDDEDPLIKKTGAKSFDAPARNVVDGHSGLLGSGRSTVVSKEKKRRLQGWRFGVAVSAALASLVLLINILFVAIASAKYAVEGGIGTLFDGDCHYVEQAAVWLHVAINVLSSLLLSASNYTMQALCSPTRIEVDRAHARGDWVDIGVPSVRNILGRIAKRRTVMWWILGLSSVPIHLLYNSAIFKTIDANGYAPMVVNSRFLDPNLFDYNVAPVGINLHSDSDVKEIRNVQKFFIDNQNSDSVLEMSNQDCISAYGTTFVSGYSDVLLFTKDEGKAENQTIFWEKSDYYDPSVEPGYNWICADMAGFQMSRTAVCDVAKAKREADAWSIASKKIDHCLARVLPGHCKLQFSQSILITVILMNCAKALVMAWALFFQKSFTLVTIGDAVASFLSSPDPLTTSRCLMTKGDVYDGPLRWQQQANGGDESTAQPLPKVYSGRSKKRWLHAASGVRWTTTVSLILIALISTGILLGVGTTPNYERESRAQAFSLGFGKIDPRLLIHADLPTQGAAGLTAAVLLANAPQTICSFLYLAYNGLFTCMLLSQEWSKYYLRPKPLRVTTPHGQQRSKRYLQLPFAYSVPLLAGSALLHWLISESIFLARVDFYQQGKRDESMSFSQTGYSPLSILIVIILGIVMLSVLVAHAFRRFSSPMPVVGSCSVAIASACHRPKDDDDAAFLPVAWGDVNQQGSGEVGHCTFTSQQVFEPMEGRMYAGGDVFLDVAHALRQRRTREEDVQNVVLHMPACTQPLLPR